MTTSQGVGLVACACWNSHATWGWRRSGFLMVILSSLIAAAMLLPYLTVLVRKAMPPILPFISQSGGAPPSTGVFAIFMILCGFFGIITFVLIYEAINHRNPDHLKIVRVSNNIALPVVLICCFGCIVTAAYPVGYTDLPNKFEWVVTVFYEHSLGACMILFGAAFFQFLLVPIWWYITGVSYRDRSLKIVLACAYCIVFLISVYPMPIFLLEELGSNPFDLTSMKNVTYELPIVFTTSYKISAFCEWAVCFLIILNFLSFYKDMQRLSFHVILRHKSCLAESLEPAPSISLKVLS